MIEWVVDKPGIKLGLGDSVEYTGDADLVFTHIYGPLPKQLIGKPAIINVYGNRKAKAEQWCGAELHEVSKWARGLTNTIYVANIPRPEIDLTALVEDELRPGRGWFPEILAAWMIYLCRDAVPMNGIVFDGFMGRGTVARGVTYGQTFVGIDRDPERIAIAREYLNV
jgi:hypothetical protein